jgi:hypothetical protein
MSLKASGESTVIISFGSDIKVTCWLVFELLLGGMLKMVRLCELALRFVSYKVCIIGEIRVNCEIGGPHV